MNAATVHRAAFHNREVGAAELVCDGVWAVPLPLVGSPVLSVIVHLLRHDDGLVLVDAGYPDDACWETLTAAIAAAGFGVRDVTHLLLTHNHPDHIGLAARVREESGAPIAIHPLDAFQLQRPLRGTFFDQLERELRLAGLPADVLGEMVDSSRRLASHSDDLLVDELLEGGQVLSFGGLELEVLWTPGHARGHVSLLDRRRRLLIGGDVLLPEGEVQVGLVSDEDDDPVAQLRDSLRRIAALPIDLLLPGHQYRFDDVAAVVARTLGEQDARLARAAEVLDRRPDASAWELTTQLDWGRPWDRIGLTGRRFAVMQAMGWQRYLERRGG